MTDGPSADVNGAPDATQVQDVIIVGSGPAGHTAAIYTARAELHPVMFEGFLAGGVAAGGQLTTTTDVENFPGFPNGVGGQEITDLFRAQAARFGTHIITETVSRVELDVFPFVVHSEWGQVWKCKALIIATGATAKRLDIPGAGEAQGEYWQRGVSACAVCDGAAPLFRDKNLFVIGGGDSAMEEAVFLTKYASMVFIVHRRDELRASKIMQRRAVEHPKIRVLYSAAVSSVIGDGNVVTHVSVKDLKTGNEQVMDAGGMFFAIGHKPNTDFLGGQLALDEAGYIVTKPGTTSTSRRGVFAAGDCQDKKYRQAITAAGTGCMAAIDVEHYLNELADA
ncbi:Thioredoxin reductase 2 [Porphyridium purpureum]|uniref:Thioredoxin reductase n=1 Tax=Porphyridium purpureum TaxID=35688 RepID=A0A5J4Z1K6_PORPP|nr:Thioredoxin reductase 2 [Porphyridium purpureum]|eukprot:POR1459..scf295_1